MTTITTPWGSLRQVVQDGVTVWKLRCPQCGHEGAVNDDQLHGRVSLDHTNCGCGCTWHETRDYSTYLPPTATT